MEICQLVEGLPLGIELPASWLRVFDCVTIARDVRSYLDTPTLTQEFAERHSTLRTVFDHSWQMLDEKEQMGLLRLSVIAGKATCNVALAIGDLSLAELVRFVDLSLLNCTNESESEPYYAIHELLRQYLIEKRQIVPYLDIEIQQAHCDFYAQWLVNFFSHWRAGEFCHRHNAAIPEGIS